MGELKVGFTATRSLTHEGRLIIRARLEGLRITHPTSTEFTTGGAPGGDTYIMGIARMLWPTAFFRLVLPESPRYNEAHVEAFERGLAQGRFGGEVVYTGLPPLKRNPVILDHSAYLVAFPKTPTEQMRGSGTWATVRYARKRGMPIDLTPLSTGEPESEQPRVHPNPAYGR